MRKILVVEDEQLLRETYRMILSTEPYLVSVAVDGEEGLELCKSTTFDLILLDLMMPKVNGTAFLEKIKEFADPLPKIIILSNLSSGDDLTKAMALGAYKSVVKADLSPRQLISLVRYELQPRD